MEPSKPPRVFISYSWESEDHKSWVRYLGERLYKSGIEARLDQWFVQPGESFTAFMEQEVTAADFILVVCTPSYARKSNNRRGGVGYEQQIVSGQLMSGTPRSKFIPILRKGDYEPGAGCAIPAHFLGIAWIEFRDDLAFEKSLEDLIRVILSKPRFAPPPLGARPSLETITATVLNQIELTEVDESIEKSDSVKTDLKEGDIEIKLDNALAYYRRGIAYSDKGDKDRAIADYDRAIEIEPDYALAYYQRGIAYSDKGDYDRAIIEYNRAIEIDPDDAEAYNARGAAYYNKGDIDRAIADYERAIEIDPDFAIAYCNRGRAYYKNGDYDPAIADYDRAIEIDPDFADVYNRRGLAYYEKGDNDRAIANYDRAIKIDPDFALHYYNRGFAYSAKGDYDRAIADFRKSLEFFTDLGYRKRALRELRRLGAK